MIKVNIKPGSTVSQDFGVFKWPKLRSDADPDTVFTAQWIGSWWECVADGYGKKGNYGNGSVFVHDENGVIQLDKQK